MLELTLLANAIWFGMGFHLFALRSNIFAKILVSTAHHETPTFDVLAATLPFLGGFDLSLCVLNVAFLINVSFFPEDEQKIILFAVFAIAPDSRFVSNIPIAFDNLKGKGVWQIKGLMRFFS